VHFLVLWYTSERKEKVMVQKLGSNKADFIFSKSNTFK